MESPPYPPVSQHGDVSRPALGFPLGTALLLIIIFSLSGIFSCCYHWDKLRSLRRSFPGGPATVLESHPDPDALKAKLSHSERDGNENQSLPVLMPGDRMPKFIAMPCPCRPPRLDKIVVEVPKPPKPPRIAVPFY